jgi:acyl carrier protein
MFVNMTFDQWKTTLASKAGTSWNLHQQLPRALDFFIQFSSLAGIHGSMGQSNYAAGCGFQDALARYRTSRGESAVSFDIGWMQNIGIISENEAYQRQRETAADMRKVQGEELLAIMDIYCDPAAAAATGPDSQLLIGVMTPEDQIRSGLEFPTATVQRPLFAGFTERTGEMQVTPTGSSAEDPVRLFKQAETPKEKAEVVVKALANKLAHALGIVADDVVPSKHLSDYGVDSLMAVELRNWIAAAFKSNVAVFDIMGAPSILDAGNVIVSKSEFVSST